MFVIVQSTLSGRAAGFQTVHASESDNLEKLISTYCAEKGIPLRPYYILRTAKNIPLDSTRTIKSYKIEEGDTLFLGSKADEDTLFGFNNWWIMAFMALIIGGVGIIALTLVYFLDVPGEPINYGVVLDAGSTHTMAFLYEWKSGKVNGTGVVQQKKSSKCKSGSISTFMEDPVGASSALSSCVDNVKNGIPNYERATSPVYLGATAGMRLLKRENETASLKILSEAGKALQQTGLLFKESRIISSSSEGEFCWITVNYLDKNLEITKSRKPHHTVGTLDLGGASTQITYEKTENSNVNVTLFGKFHRLYTHSFLCFGLRQIHQRYLTSLMKDLSGKTTKFDDPCAPANNHRSVSSDVLFQTVCSVSKDIKNNMKNLKGKNFTFVGKSDLAQCKKRVDALFNITECKKLYQEDLCFSSIPAFDHSKFLALSGFNAVINDFNSTNVTLASFKNNIDSFCKKTWGQLVKYKENQLITNYCFDGQYVYHLLVAKYGFDASSWPNVIFINKIHGTDLGWTLGFMLNETNSLIGKPQPDRPISLTALIILLVLFCTFLVLAVSFGCHAMKQHRQKFTYERSANYETFVNELESSK